MTRFSERTVSRRAGLGMAASAAVAAVVVGPLRSFAQTPEAPLASDLILPDGPLGVHAMWLLEVANAGPGQITAEEITTHFDPTFFDVTPIDDVLAVLSALQSAGITYEIDPESFVTTRDLPATNGRFILIGSDGSYTEVALTINRDTELISMLVVAPEESSATAAASPVASPASDLIVPDGPLGEHALWLLETANAGPGQITAEEITAHFDPAFLEETPVEDVLTKLSDLQSAGITYEIDQQSFITTMDFPATNGRFILIGSDGSRTEIGLTINRDSELMSGFHLAPEGEPVASPEA